MIRKISSLFGVLAFLLSAFIFTSGNVYAHSSSISRSAHAYSSSAQGPSCAHLQVYLNGNAAPKSKCLDTSIKTSTQFGSIIPAINAVPCDSGSLVLYADPNFAGWTLCLKGAGATDLGIYHGPAPFYYYTWNDLPSSYITGCSMGIFYTDAGESGSSQVVNNEKNNFDGLNGRLPDNSLSSVHLSSNC